MISNNRSLCAVGIAPMSRAGANNSAFYWSVSKLAPARKSAQIISKQYPRDLSVPSIGAAASTAR
jgi:hypothetical protein